MSSKIKMRSNENLFTFLLTVLDIHFYSHNTAIIHNTSHIAIHKDFMHFVLFVDGRHV